SVHHRLGRDLRVTASTVVALAALLVASHEIASLIELRLPLLALRLGADLLIERVHFVQKLEAALLFLRRHRAGLFLPLDFQPVLNLLECGELRVAFLEELLENLDRYLLWVVGDRPLTGSDHASRTHPPLVLGTRASTGSRPLRWWYYVL